MNARLATPATALVGVAACVAYSGGAHPIDPARLTVESGWIVAASTPEVRQRGPLDCGAASLAMIAGRWHIPFTIDAAVAALPTPSQHGTRLGDLRDVARARGLTAFAIAGDRATLIHEVESGRPVIVGLLLPFGSNRAQSHYEVIVAVRPSDDQFVTIDPAKGWRTYTWADLDAEWRPAGRPTLVVLGPRSQVANT